MLLPLLIRILPLAVAQVPARRCYGALLAFAAVLLVGIHPARLPVRGYRAGLVLQRHVLRGAAPLPTPALAATASPATDARSLDIAQDLRTAISRGVAAERIAAAAGLDPSEVSLGERLEIALGADGNPWSAPITVTARAASQPQALQVAEAAAREIAAVLDDREGRQAARSDERQARWEVREMRHYETRARDALDEYLASWQPRESSEPSTESSVARPASDRGSAAVVSSSSFSRTEHGADTGNAAGGNTFAAPAGKPAADYATWSRLRNDYERAVSRRLEAERQNEAALHRLIDATRTVRSWQFSRPQVMDRIGGQLPWHRLAGLLVLAIGSAGFVYWWSGRRGVASTFQRVEDLRDAVGMPVLVAVAPAAGSASGGHRQSIRPAAWVVLLAAELIVAAFFATWEFELRLGGAAPPGFLDQAWPTPMDLIPRWAAGGRF